MASLQDQLRKAGMVDAKKAKQLEKEKRKQAKQRKKGEAAPDSSAKVAADQAKVDKLNKDREANRQQQLAAEQKAIAAQIIQLIETNCIDRGKSDVGFQFVDGKKIKKIYVDEVLQRQLEKGQIAIVTLRGNYELVSAAVAEKIAQRDPDIIILLNEKTTNAEGETEEEDPYAAYKIPDDLMW